MVKLKTEKEITYKNSIKEWTTDIPILIIELFIDTYTIYMYSYKSNYVWVNVVISFWNEETSRQRRGEETRQWRYFKCKNMEHTSS